MTIKERKRFETYEFALEMKANIEQLPKVSKEAMYLYIDKIDSWALEKTKANAPVKTGATKNSIKKAPIREYRKSISGGLELTSWLDRWIGSSGQVNYNKEVSLLVENTDMNRTKARKYLTKKHGTDKLMKKVHPAYWGLRPIKQLMRSIKSEKTLERYMNLKLKTLEIKD